MSLINALKYFWMSIFRYYVVSSIMHFCCNHRILHTFIPKICDLHSEKFYYSHLVADHNKWVGIRSLHELLIVMQLWYDHEKSNHLFHLDYSILLCSLQTIDVFTVMCAILDNTQVRIKGRDALGLRLRSA